MVAERVKAVRKGKAHGEQQPKRTLYDNHFKQQVVLAALQRPPDNRIKPTCAMYPGIEPCQVLRPLELRQDMNHPFFVDLPVVP